MKKITQEQWERNDKLLKDILKGNVVTIHGVSAGKKDVSVYYASATVGGLAVDNRIPVWMENFNFALEVKFNEAISQVIQKEAPILIEKYNKLFGESTL